MPSDLPPPTPRPLPLASLIPPASTAPLHISLPLDPPLSSVACSMGGRPVAEVQAASGRGKAVTNGHSLTHSQVEQFEALAALIKVFLDS